MYYRRPRTLARFCKGVLPHLLRGADGRRAVGFVADIVETDHWNSFDRFRETTRTIVRHYEAAGADTQVYRIPTGGRIGSGRWIVHEAEDILAATAEVIRPVRRRVLDYAKNPWHVIQWTSSTPRAA